MILVRSIVTSRSSKIKLLLRLAAFIALLPEGRASTYIANEKWDLNQLAHVHSVSICVLVTSSPESSNLIGQYRVYISHINL